jgi:acyl-CoA synthetase (AMP-forming)/AMP-acid ligase II
MTRLLDRGEPNAVALVDTAENGSEVTYAELRERVERTAEGLRSTLSRGLVLHVADDSVDSIVVYLACLEAECPAVLLEPEFVDRLEALIAGYAPAAILANRSLAVPDASGPGVPFGVDKYRLYRHQTEGRPLSRELALLLTTSGSTGSPKLVRLSHANLLSNARSIVQYLEITPAERSMQTLPTHYSYGLSLLNSHLLAGATTVLCAHSFLRPEFWGAFAEAGCTSFAGVPYIYETLARLRFDPSRYPSLRTMTQAGGALSVDLTRDFYERTAACECRLFVMYGQTEATARMAYVPSSRLAEKIGSIGIAIPDGTLSLESCDGTDRSELIYTGPNVMLGYAETADDLALGDVQGGVLRTGDLASVDSDGFYRIEGRIKRFAKLFGRRLSLDEVERDLEDHFAIRVAAVEREGRLAIFASSVHDALPDGIDLYLAKRLRVPPKVLRVEHLEALPRTPSGKKNYKELPG